MMCYAYVLCICSYTLCTVSCTYMLCAMLCTYACTYMLCAYVACVCTMHTYPDLHVCYVHHPLSTGAGSLRSGVCVALLHAVCSGPRYLVRSWSSWPRSHGSRTPMACSQRQHTTPPVATRGAHCARRRRCVAPYPRAWALGFQCSLTTRPEIAYAASAVPASGSGSVRASTAASRTGHVLPVGAADPRPGVHLRAFGRTCSRSRSTAAGRTCSTGSGSATCQ